MTTGCIFTNTTNFILFSLTFEIIFFQVSIPGGTLIFIRKPIPEGMGSPLLTSFSRNHVSATILVVSIGALTGMSIDHEVPNSTSSGLLSDDFPVTVGFKGVANVADHCTEVLYTEARPSFVCRKTTTVRKVVDHTTLLRKVCTSHNKEFSNGAESYFEAAPLLHIIVSFTVNQSIYFCSFF
jgi:hypothetical protein